MPSLPVLSGRDAVKVFRGLTPELLESMLDDE